MSEKKQYEFGYPDEQFESVISENLHCGICSCVFKDPIMCKNEHCFCRGCITKHLQNSQTCPSCMQDLTVESLSDAPRILRNLLSEQRIRCDHHERGCQEIVQLENLASHVAMCGKAPVMCANEGCTSQINREDQFRHQGEECKFRKAGCQNCKEMGSMAEKISQNLGALCNKFEELNADVDKMKTMADQVPSTYPSRDLKEKPSNARAYVVAGGDGAKDSVEIFDKTSNSWIQLHPMTRRRAYASSAVYNGHVLVTGGITDSNHVLCTIEQFSSNVHPFIPPSWSKLQVNLLRPLREHCCMVYNGRLIVLGGYDNEGCSDIIYEIQLQFPFAIKVLAKLPPSTPIKGCGAVLKSNKIFIFGGRSREETDIASFGFSRETNIATENVLMYDITKNEFKELAPLPYKVCNMATVKYEDNIILVGGCDHYDSWGNVKNTVISYNTETQKSTELPPMKNGRVECCAVVDGDTLVVMGGTSKFGKKKQYNTSLSSLEVFDFTTSEWSDFPSMQEARKAFIAEII